MLLLLLLGCFHVFCGTDADQLVQVHVMYRHGDRTPIEAYPTDPNKAYWDTMPAGELTTIGMGQHFNQGLKLKERYMKQLYFINSTYARSEITVVSSPFPRCVQSALSNLAGLYSGSVGTYPSVNGWPGNWSPIPIQTLDGEGRLLVDIFQNCPRADVLMTERGANPAFVRYQAENAPMMEEVKNKGGYAEANKSNLDHFNDCIMIERLYRNLPQPSWITNKLANETMNDHFRTVDFTRGQADFGVPDSTPLLQLGGGPFLTKILNDMIAYQNGSTSLSKMYFYSTHDSLLDMILTTLGTKTLMVGPYNCNYAAMLIFELWKGDNGLYYVTMNYSADENSNIISYTQYIDQCPTSYCPFQKFYERNKPYLVPNADKLCLEV